MSSGRIIKSADGTDIYAEAVGNPSKPAVVFIHGFSMSAMAFNAIFDDPLWIADLYLVRYDVRGHGRSGKPTDEATWESRRLAEDFDAVVDAFGLVRPFVLGWSLGGTYITDILCFKPPTYVSGIIYAAPLPYMGPTLAKVGSAACLATLPGLTQGTDVDAYHANALAFLGLCLPHSTAQASDDFYLGCLGSSLVQPRAVTVRLLSRTQDERALLRAGRDGALPLLVVLGARDRVIVRQAVLDAVEGWKNMDVVDIEDAEHFLWISRPDKFRETVVGWVSAHT
ncbi:Alpha/Beta hydrolase protein [Mycena pura]|uniref:Alpha/Beta hydrolase protein n=1 Tax=Mycena pura TaxID=153505 RepID=A0AAD6YC96_9AGAR|nr:Alpha/Beta hydrolase protein [Mycena pura]